MTETCCFGRYSAATGTLIISTKSMIGSVSAIIGCSIVAHFMISKPEMFSEEHFPLPGFQTYAHLYIASQFVGISLALVYGVLSGLLFQGYRKKNVRICKPWLYWNYVSLVLVSIVIFCAIVAEFVILTYMNILILNLFAVFIVTIGLGVQIYDTIVVQRFINELEGDIYTVLIEDPGEDHLSIN